MTAATMTRKRRVQLPPRDDNGPTVERCQHQDFRTANGVTRVKSTVESLRHSGDIGDDEVLAAERWKRDFDFADHGHVDPHDEPIPDGYVRGDVHTFNLARGKASGRISEARTAVGLCGHQILVMMLGHQMTFTAMGRALHADISPTAGRAKVGAKCSIVLSRLAEHYAELRKKKRRDELLARACAMCE